MYLGLSHRASEQKSLEADKVDGGAVAAQK